MIIKSIYIQQGLFCTERKFTSGFNLIYSEKNSTGKTTLMRCILYGLGYTVPGTKKFRIESTSVRLTIQQADGKELVLKRESTDSIELLADEIQYSYVLPTQLNELHTKLYGTDNADILNNLLGAIYADQEKGWTLLNRGKAIAGIRFNIDELIRGLSGRDCSSLLLRKHKVEENLKKYKDILNIAKYRESIDMDPNSLVGIDYDKERVLRINQLKAEIESLRKDIKRIDHNIAVNQKTINLIEQMKLVIRLQSGEDVCVTPDMVVGAVDCVDLLKAKKKLLLSKLDAVIKEIEKLELEGKEEEQQLAIFGSESLADVFDRKMADVDVSPADVQAVISKLEKEKASLTKLIAEYTNDNNSVTQSMVKTVQKYMTELGDPDAAEIPWKYLFTSNLKELSGAVLHRTVFSFRLAYITEIEKVLGIKLPILLDSPKGKEVDDDNIRKMMRILQRDFLDNQIIIASIYHYVEGEYIIPMGEQLLDQTVQFN